MSRFLRNIYIIFSTHNLPDSLNIFFDYIVLIAHNRFSPSSLTEKILSYNVYFPNRDFFFSSFTEIFLQNIYNFPKNKDRLVIFDCGTNIGLSALYFKWRCPNARVSCFEPNPEVIEYLRQNISKNNLKIDSNSNFSLIYAERKAI